jgi:predicted dehydrogenase
MKRRDLIKGAALAFPYIAAPTVRGANDRAVLGFIGVGNRARWLLQHEDFGVGRIVAMADINPESMSLTTKIHPDAANWNRYADYRKMLEKEKLDGVFVETPTHARVLICLHAIMAGFDVYAEKPLTLTVEEGQVLTRAVRKHKRILQTGTQQRSMPINIYASELVSSGKFGKIEKVIVCNFLGPERWKDQPAQPMPEGLNWDQWCNQTPLRPYHSKLHRGWATWWDYDGGGQSWGISGWGTHSLDQVQAALGTSLTGPVEIWPVEPGPNGKLAMRYANGTLVSLEEPKIDNHDQLGAHFVGTNGRIQIIRGDFRTDREDLKKGSPDVIKEGPGEDAWHIKNFVDCIKTRKKPNADVEIAHRSTTICHLLNICRDLGRKLEWDPKTERFPKDEEANKLLCRLRRKGYELPQV